jgi:hypothetical protein
MISNKLMLNDSKTELLLVAPKQHIESILACKPRVKVGDAIIEPVECVRDLGAMLDRHMSMIPQVTNVCRSMYHHIRLISKIRKHLTTDACTTVINALVTSRLDLNNGLLIGLPSTQLTRLQVAQNCAARVVAGIRGRDHISPVLQALHWLPVTARISYKILLTTFKVLNTLCPPEYLAALLHQYKPSRSLRSTDKELLHIPKVTKKVGARAFQYAAPHLWNALKPDLRKSSSIQSFKKDLKTTLFNQAT